MKTWTVEMSQMEWALFRVVLKIMEFPYEVSEAGDLVHIEITCSEQDAIALEATHTVMSTNLKIKEGETKPC